MRELAASELLPLPELEAELFVSDYLATLAMLMLELQVSLERIFARVKSSLGQTCARCCGGDQQCANAVSRLATA